MSAKEKIAKLEGLLARVKERAEAPRPNAGAVLTGARAQSSRPAALPAEVARAEAARAAAPAEAREPVLAREEHPSAERAPISTTPPPESVPAPETTASIPAAAATGWSEPPPETAVDPAFDASGRDGPEQDTDMDVEVSTEIVEVDIDIDEPSFVPAESGAQLVSEQAGEVEDTEELSDQLGLLATSVPSAAVEPSVAPPANELVVPAPSSSPRPISSGGDEAEGSDDEPTARHTPPPESGKQVAAPSVKPEPSRKTSIPPPSLEGHTLIGGWREPGASLPRDLRMPGVRVPPPPPPPPPPPEEASLATKTAPPPSVAPPVATHATGRPAPLAPPTAPPPSTASSAPRALPRSALPPPLSADVTSPVLPDAANVASIASTPPVFAPASFGDLLDATLAL